MAFRKGMKRNADEGTPLRKSAGTDEPSVEQTNLLGAFIASAIVSGNGVYGLRYMSSGAIKLTLYVDGDKYNDTLNVAEDWKVLFDDYAKQLGFQAYYREAAARLPGAAPVSAPESGGKSLRGARLPEADLP